MNRDGDWRHAEREMGVRTNFQEEEEENLSYLRENAHRLPETKLKREIKG